jgi:malate dehydrogenase
LKKVSLIGAGNIGGSLASIIANKNLADVMLIDVIEGMAEGKALDISQAIAITESSSKVEGSTKLEEIKDSDVIIVTAGIARKPGMSRDDLIETNLKIMKTVGSAIKEYSPNAFVICITNPLDAMVWSLKKISGVKKEMIVGMAGVLDSSRFRFFLASELNISSTNINAMVLGGHGDTMVPLLRYTTINGIPMLDLITKGLITKNRLDEIIERTRNGGGEIVKLMKNSSAFVAPATCAVEMAESFLKNQKKILPCSTYLSGEYGYEDIFIGVPIIIGKEGVEKVIELKFEKNEADDFTKSVNAVSDLTQKCKKILE